MSIRRSTLQIQMIGITKMCHWQGIKQSWKDLQKHCEFFCLQVQQTILRLRQVKQLISNLKKIQVNHRGFLGPKSQMLPQNSQVNSALLHIRQQLAQEEPSFQMISTLNFKSHFSSFIRVRNKTGLTSKMVSSLAMISPNSSYMSNFRTISP